MTYQSILKIKIFVLAAIFLVSCRQQNFNTVNSLSKDEQTAFKTKIIRYVAELPKYATYENRFESRFDEPYNTLVKKTYLDKYYVAEDGYTYFEVRKVAPSLKVKFNATGGRLKVDANGNITDYSEIYRTWKMEDEELAEQTGMLFPKMVNGDDLSPYYTDNAGGKLIIEFPDKNVEYNSDLRRWVTKGTIN
ncbi:hypothetical protein [Polluticaenibacter yanchengensis]|uniref:LPS export ABC transporter periplasmic protein LptC n=1 Tax=Polluticaenibacter yanchengensis TaxID=3014562 RepID=A0ABT4UGX8_9BACT|nr:hypothetical protein [Chitinophagaceae bacterium LY-5]